MSALTVEVNDRQFSDAAIPTAAGVILMTPPLDEDYWLLRVPLGDNAIVVFPKFGTYGIGFQKEEDWNTNLPYTCPAVEIWSHIRHNKGDKRITKQRSLEAIKLAQSTLRGLLGADAKPEMAPSHD